MDGVRSISSWMRQNHHQYQGIIVCKQDGLRTFAPGQSCKVVFHQNSLLFQIVALFRTRDQHHASNKQAGFPCEEFGVFEMVGGGLYSPRKKHGTSLRSCNPEICGLIVIGHGHVVGSAKKRSRRKTWCGHSRRQGWMPQNPKMLGILENMSHYDRLNIVDINAGSLTKSTIPQALWNTTHVCCAFAETWKGFLLVLLEWFWAPNPIAGNIRATL